MATPIRSPDFTTRRGGNVQKVERQEMQPRQSPTIIFRVFSEIQSVIGIVFSSALSKKRQIPPTPFVEGGAFNGPLFFKEGLG